jgi:DNA ligase-1
MLTDILYKYDSTGKIRTYQIEIDDDRYRMITGTKDGKKVESKWTVCTAKNLGKSNQIFPANQAIVEAKARITKKLSSNYYKTEAECMANPEQFFQPMLATERSKVKPPPTFPLIIDPKLDGMRLICQADSYKSRKGKEVPAAKYIFEELEDFFAQYPNITLDGEIYSHDLKDDFNTLMSIARRETLNTQQEETAKDVLQYHVYDMFDFDEPDMMAIDRKAWLELNLPVSYRIRLVHCTIVDNETDLLAINQNHIADGYEGSIARTVKAPYENKRSKHLIKIKQFITEEFCIMDVLEGTGNRSGIAGTVVISTNANILVGCGIRGSWAYAKELLDNRNSLISKTATVRHFGFTPDGSLRFPICIDVDRPD